MGGVAARRNGGLACVTLHAKFGIMIRTHERTSVSGLLGAGLIAVTVTTALVWLGPLLLLEFGGFYPGPERSAGLKAEIGRYAGIALGMISLSVPLGLFGACFALWAVMRRALVGLAGRRPGLAGVVAGLGHTVAGLVLIAFAFAFGQADYGSPMAGLFAIPLIITGHLLLVLICGSI